MALAVMSVPYAAALLVALGSTMNLGRRLVPTPELASTLAPNLDLAA